MNPLEFETVYQEYAQDLKRYLPDGIVEVDLTLLQELGILSYEPVEEDEDDQLSHNFYVVESPEKLTLFNHKFVVWIVPKMVNETPTTYALIALHKNEKARLEMAFSTSGVYNHSSLVLRILEKFLAQIEENNDEICRFKH